MVGEMMLRREGTTESSASMGATHERSPEVYLYAYSEGL